MLEEVQKGRENSYETQVEEEQKVFKETDLCSDFLFTTRWERFVVEEKKGSKWQAEEVKQLMKEGESDPSQLFSDEGEAVGGVCTK